jgi:hypothetical protein
VIQQSTRRTPDALSAFAVSGTCPDLCRQAESGCSTKRVDQAKPYVLGLFQIAIGLLFAHHGDASLFK